MNKRVLVTGATGLIGKGIVKELCSQGAYVKVIARNTKKAKGIFREQLMAEIIDLNMMNRPLKLRQVIEETDAVINLAGTNLSSKRWDEDFKSEIYLSRTGITKLITDTIKISDNKPECFVSASGAGYYGFRGDEELDENSSNPGNDFLSSLCRDWESEALLSAQENVRVVLMRTGIVFDKSEGALPELLKPFKFFAGAYLGNGKQWMSWIHIADIIRLYLFAVQNDKIYGPLNGTSPDPVTNKILCQSIGKYKNTKLLLPVPEFALKIAVGEFAENLYNGQKVMPLKALESGFVFSYPTLKSALDNLLGK
ncbi:MAG: TIGR01777 family oxidoreductase [Ignavibacteria bacterium]|nr:TIGR01777 family oxidoreductase [Ignavibacteria bacterium]